MTHEPTDGETSEKRPPAYTAEVMTGEDTPDHERSLLATVQAEEVMFDWFSVILTVYPRGAQIRLSLAADEAEEIARHMLAAAEACRRGR